MTHTIELPPTAEKAARLLAHILGDPDIAREIGPALSCQEADSVAAALSLLGRTREAATWLAWHAIGTEEPVDDLHAGWPYPEEAEGYTPATEYALELARREAVKSCLECGAGAKTPCAWECSTRWTSAGSGAAAGE